MNTASNPSEGANPLLWDKDTAPSPGFQKTKEVGLYLWVMIASPALKLP